MGQMTNNIVWLPASLVFLVMFFISSVATAFVEVPQLTGRIVDNARLLNAEQNQALDIKLADLELSKGSQIVLLTLPTTKPETIEQYSIRVADAWKIGRQDIDDGIIILIAKNDRKMRIEVGYGLEGAVPDAIAFRIIQDYMRPAFKQGDFNKGINDAVDALVAQVNNEPLALPQTKKSASSDLGISDILFPTLIIFFFIQGIWVAIFGRLLGASLAACIVGGIGLFTGSALIFTFFLVGFTFLFMYSSGQGIYYGQRGRNGGIMFPGGHGRGGGGFGGGGFGGGGGGFGGGGASGGW